MSLSDDVKTLFEDDDALMALLTGGVHNDVEEISYQNTPSAFDANRELMPCVLIKFGTETRLRSGIPNSVQTPLTIYFYQRDNYDVIEPAIDSVFVLLNEQKVGTNVWNVEFDIAVSQQRDVALDCPLGMLRFVAKRMR